MLVRENTAGLSAAQLAAANRTLSVEFLDGAGVNQFDFALNGSTHQLSILSEADAAGQDQSTGGFNANTTYLLVGKLSPNGSGANLLQASIFPTSVTVGDVTAPNYVWMLSALGSNGYNPPLTGLQITSPAEGNFTLSNIWIGTTGMIPEPGSASGLVPVLLALRVRAKNKPANRRV
jgi:hypothetical protein